MITSMMDQIKMLKSSPDNKDKPKSQDTTTVVPANKRARPPEGGHSKKIGRMWTLKHETSSPKFYEILIKIELKEDTATDLKKLYNYIRMYLNAVNITREDIIPD